MSRNKTLIEMHCHTLRHSPCSLVDPVTLVKRLMEMGMNGVVLTEHHYLWEKDELEQLKTKSGAGENFVILSGQEVGTDKGHVLVYGADETIDEIVTLKTLRQNFPQAALIWAHPFRWNASPAEEDLLNPCLDGIEILNSNQLPHENRASLKAWKQLACNAVGGSDTHSIEQAACFPTLFEKKITTMHDLVEEIKARRCKPVDNDSYTLS